MAEVTVKSAEVAKRDANPIEFAKPTTVAMLHEAVGYAAVPPSASIDSKFIMCSIPSSARVSQVLAYATDMGATGDTDIGLYRTTKDGGAEVDADFFAADLDINAAAVNGADVTHQSGVYGLDDVEKTIWEALGLSADPQLMYDVVATLTEAVDGTGGNLALKVKFAY